MDVEILLEILQALANFDVRYVIVGGVALNLHGLARATADIDIFVEPTSSNIGRLREALTSLFEDPDIALISSDDLNGAYPAIQYIPPRGNFHIDILARLGEAFSYEEIESELTEIEGIPARVATPKMLYRMKRNTVRLQDKADAEKLKERFELEDEECDAHT
ncbi:MAG: nucleotidyl transferase AbiEii/AbiGii toxin family protein [Deltaproteobacteria bacterium]|nr:nucleotidyl transferase AbiEii/AbiGii toxin family protein [Deltaproteobacteria bacterium]